MSQSGDSKQSIFKDGLILKEFLKAFGKKSAKDLEASKITQNAKRYKVRSDFSSPELKVSYQYIHG